MITIRSLTIQNLSFYKKRVLILKRLEATLLGCFLLDPSRYAPKNFTDIFWDTSKRCGFHVSITKQTSVTSEPCSKSCTNTFVTCVMQNDPSFQTKGFKGRCLLKKMRAATAVPAGRTFVASAKDNWAKRQVLKCCTQKVGDRRVVYFIVLTCVSSTRNKTKMRAHWGRFRLQRGPAATKLVKQFQIVIKKKKRL